MTNNWPKFQELQDSGELFLGVMENELGREPEQSEAEKEYLRINKAVKGISVTSWYKEIMKFIDDIIKVQDIQLDKIQTCDEWFYNIIERRRVARDLQSYLEWFIK